MVSALIGGALAAGSAIASAYASHKQNERNIKEQKKQNEITRQREDNAYQRAVRDAKASGLSPLAVVGTSGASAQSMSAPQQKNNPIADGLSNSMGVLDSISQNRMNNSLIAKTDAETQGQSIHNANAQAEYTLKLLKLKSEIDNIDTKTAQDKIFIKNFNDRLNAELEGQRLSNNAKSQDILFKKSANDWNNSVGFNPLTSWSASASAPIGYGVSTGRELELQREEAVANAKRQQEINEATYNQALTASKTQYQIILKDWTRQYEAVKKSLKGKQGASAKLDLWLKNNPKPKWSDYKPRR